MPQRKATTARSVRELIESTQTGARPKYLLFWGHRARPDGTLGASCLSQWWPTRFTVDGQSFRSAEHYMMWRKAELFGDSRSASDVLRATSPAQAKAIGRRVQRFDEATWAAHRWDIVVAASVAKFGGEPALHGFLQGTGNRVLVEASPADRIWGIGLAADSEFATVPQRWKGLNLLGFALMEARERLSRSGA